MLRFHVQVLIVLMYSMNGVGGYVLLPGSLSYRLTTAVIYVSQWHCQRIERSAYTALFY